MKTAPIPADVIAGAQASRRTWGCPASIAIAQWAVESARGTKMTGRNNPFGMKATASQPATAVPTHEVVNGKSVAIVARFRDFASLAEAFDAHGKLLATGSAYVEARRHLGDPEAYAHALTGHYATDPHYGDTLVSVMRGSGLYAYDVPGPLSAPIVMASAPAPLGFWATLAHAFGLAASRPIG